MPHTLSIQSKIHLALASIFLLVLVVVISVAVSAEKKLAKEMVEDKLKEKASSYLDSVNMLMVSGAIANRELVRSKMLSDPNILDARIIRHAVVDKLYGQGFEHEYPKDELDKRGLNGEEVLVNQNDSQGHRLTYVMPVLAYQDYRGTNCITCHQVNENAVLGAIRITYSLDQLDQDIHSNMLRMGSIQAAMLIAALLVLTFLLRRLVIHPVQRLHNTMTQVERSSDLTAQAQVSSQDEIGATALAFNTMLKRFDNSLAQVVRSATKVKDASAQINHSSQASFSSAQAQKQESLAIEHAIQGLHSSIEQVSLHAQESNQASLAAQVVAQSGVSKTDQAAQSIETMHQAIEDAAKVIHSLDERSNTVGSVLSVIKGIAEQTNLLALNAAIEAARAGESGRGFAVVADEVRTLSKRTADSTQEIERMIAQLQSEARHAVESMNNAQSTANEGMSRVKEAADALYSMTEQVARMNRLSEETLKLMQEQVRVGTEVNGKVESIRDLSVQSADTAKDAVQVANDLAALATELSHLVKQFKLGSAE